MSLSNSPDEQPSPLANERTESVEPADMELEHKQAIQLPPSGGQIVSDIIGKYSPPDQNSYQKAFTENDSPFSSPRSSLDALSGAIDILARKTDRTEEETADLNLLQRQHDLIQSHFDALDFCAGPIDRSKKDDDEKSDLDKPLSLLIEEARLKALEEAEREVSSSDENDFTADQEQSIADKTLREDQMTQQELSEHPGQNDPVKLSNHAEKLLTGRDKSTFVHHKQKNPYSTSA